MEGKHYVEYVNRKTIIANALAGMAVLGLALAAPAQTIITVPGQAETWPAPLAVGPNANGSAAGDSYVLGADTVPNTGNYYIYHWVNGAWVYTGGAASIIAVSPQGVPWAITDNRVIYYWNGSTFHKRQATAVLMQSALDPVPRRNPMAPHGLLDVQTARSTTW